ncbi:MAG: hypothetical protein K8F91_05575, partial [Candidatus Obscuribacterales bacterium]|nr:hypothetical protein [Candidatus Obscuribacterales bacterium]
VANGIMDLAGLVSSRLESTKPILKPKDLIGASAEITVPITRNSVGEIITDVSGTRVNYPARGLDRNSEFAKGEVVKIALAGSSACFVESAQEASPDKTANSSKSTNSGKTAGSLRKKNSDAKESN